MIERAKPRKRLRRNRESTRWLTRLRGVESPDVTFTGERFPIVMSKARGLRVTDVDGNRYSDFTACFGVLALGHGSETVKNAVRRQLPKLVHGMGDVHPSRAKVELLETLARVTPFSNAKSILGLSGSDAVEAALKTAMVATKRSQFLSFSGGYHGLNLGPLALSDRKHFRNGFESWIDDKSTILPFPFDASFPETLACVSAPLSWKHAETIHGMKQPAEVLSLLESALKSKQYAAVVMEPLQGRGGDRNWPEGFVRECADLAHRHGTLVIFDEVFTGFGRTGKFWGHEWHGVIPDLLCVGKAMGGGFPLSACIAEAPLMDSWGVSKGEARHTSTFLGHPLACAVGRAVILEIEKRSPMFQSELAKIEKEFARFVLSAKEKGLADTFPFVIRGLGMMRGLWFFDAPEGFAAQLAEELLEVGYLALPSGPRGDVLSFTPPLVTTSSDVRAFLAAVLRILASRAGIS